MLPDVVVESVELVAENLRLDRRRDPVVANNGERFAHHGQVVGGHIVTEHRDGELTDGNTLDDDEDPAAGKGDDVLGGAGDGHGGAAAGEEGADDDEG